MKSLANSRLHRISARLPGRTLLVVRALILTLIMTLMLLLTPVPSSAQLLSVSGNGADNTITYVQSGIPTEGMIWVDHVDPPVVFTNIVDLELSGEAGDDHIGDIITAREIVSSNINV